MTKYPITFLAALALSLGAVGQVAAEPLTVTFETTMVTDFFETVFGLSGESIPLSWSVTYDADLAPILFVAQGTHLGGTDVAAHDFFGYDAAGFTETSLSFGTKTFTAVAFENTNIGGYSRPAAGNMAQRVMWLDADIRVAAPTGIAIRMIRGSPDSAYVGGFQSNIGGTSLQNSIDMEDGSTGGTATPFGNELTLSVCSRPAEELGSISIISRTPQGVRMTISPVFGRQIGVEYSEDMSPGSWIELGNFFQEDCILGVLVFIDPDSVRRAQPSGYYRAFLRPEVP